MTSRPAAALVVASHDRPALLARTLPAMAAALGPGDDLVVVESGGAPAGPGGLAGRRLASPHRGKSAKLNEGVAACTQPVVVLTDDDCAVRPGWVDAMAAPFADPAVGVVFGPVVGLTTVPGSGGLPAVAAGPAPFVTWTYAHGAAMAVRRLALDEVGGFDERLGPGAPAHGEEHDVLLRLRARGWRAVVADAPPVEHVAWRDAGAEAANRLVYERGAGAFLGAAVRRSPSTGLRLLAARLRYLAGLRSVPPAAAFAGGLAYGLRMSPRNRPSTRSRSVVSAWNG